MSALNLKKRRAGVRRRNRFREHLKRRVALLAEIRRLGGAAILALLVIVFAVACDHDDSFGDAASTRPPAPSEQTEPERAPRPTPDPARPPKCACDEDEDDDAKRCRDCRISISDEALIFDYDDTESQWMFCDGLGKCEPIDAPMEWRGPRPANQT